MKKEYIMPAVSVMYMGAEAAVMFTPSIPNDGGEVTNPDDISSKQGFYDFSMDDDFEE
ncbi:MAG: hypothetical protein SO013_01125 [Prevotella sp.]|nr:hypothetical protein [Prevotellaceae bacterium]MDY3364852.1 hypothetical protein [Prevotella sp.]MDY3851484.1 hypothetical protein [Prevotella sp.]